jgi:peroxiredoxin
MKNKNVKSLLLGVGLMLSSAFASGYDVSNKTKPFQLKNIDGNMLSLEQMTENQKGAIVVFTCNHCPFAKAYEDRIIALDKLFKTQGYPVIAINSNDAVKYPDDSFENMQIRAAQKGFTFPYLVDETQEIAKEYGATKTPQVFVLQKDKKDFVLRYVGAIDDNDQNPAQVKEKYVEMAIGNLLKGERVQISTTKAIGCTIKWKKS